MAENTVVCPTLDDVLAAEQCVENFAGLGEVVYVGRKSDLAEPMTLTGVSYSTPKFLSGKGLVKIECAEATQGITGSSLKSGKGYKLQLDFVIDAVSKKTAEVSRALNNLKDLFFIVPDNEDYQIMYDPLRKCKVDQDGIQSNTGKDPSDERQTTCSYILQPVRHSNLFVEIDDIEKLMHDYVEPTDPE